MKNEKNFLPNERLLVFILEWRKAFHCTSGFSFASAGFQNLMKIFMLISVQKIYVNSMNFDHTVYS